MSRYDYAPGAAHAAEGKIDLRLAAAHDVGDRAAAAASMRPAERAMPGVEIQVCITRRANVGHVRRRRRPQPGPELRALRISGPGEQLEGTAQDGPAAHFVQLRVVAVQLRRAGNAQPLAQPRAHELVLVVR